MIPGPKGKGSASAIFAKTLPLPAGWLPGSRQEVPRVVALILAVGQGTFAFAPAAFGLIRDQAGADAAPVLLPPRWCRRWRSARYFLAGGCDSTNSAREYP
jgi:hypothetical protein